MTQRIYYFLHPILSLGGFGVWSYIMINGQKLDPVSTIALLSLILATAGLGHFIGDVTGRGGGGGGSDGG